MFARSQIYVSMEFYMVTVWTDRFRVVRLLHNKQLSNKIKYFGFNSMKS